MAGKINIWGNVSQFINGNVRNVTSPGNVGDLNSDDVDKRANRISDLQQRKIRALVKEWAAICRKSELEIYKTFIADHGIRYFDELPSEHYSTVKETLEEWISAATPKANLVPADGVMVPRNTRSSYQYGCAACAEKDASFARAQKALIAQWVLIFLLTLFCGWLLYKMPAPV